MDLASNAFVDLETLKAWLKQDQGDDAHDEALTLIINGVSASIERRTGRWLVTREATERFDGTGKSILFLRRFPLVAIAGDPAGTITIYDADGAVYEELDSSDYQLDTRLGRILRTCGTWPCGFQNIEVPASYGYGARAELLDHQDAGAMVLAALDIMKYLYDQWSTGGIAVTSMNLQNLNLQINTGIPKELRERIDSFKVRRF